MKLPGGTDGSLRDIDVACEGPSSRVTT
jgi:hypothetical protein